MPIRASTVGWLTFEGVEGDVRGAGDQIPASSIGRQCRPQLLFSNPIFSGQERIVNEKGAD
jgi:hypothetical protein